MTSGSAYVACPECGERFEGIDVVPATAEQRAQSAGIVGTSTYRPCGHSRTERITFHGWPRTWLQMPPRPVEPRS